ncbi:hypothetical protein OBK16_00010 [Empedobacter falsenii]|uniref:hypothetical protein n=1 Tax=Empedobacter falsenii TaxID=343874 RepID=UPI003A80EBEF
MDKNPFSLYDFLGYFIPGAFALYLIVLVQNTNGIETYFKLESIENLKYEISLIYIIFFTIISYILGHILSYISSSLIEKYTILIYGYPSKLLLGIKFKRDEYKAYPIILKLAMFILLFPLIFIDILFYKVFKIDKSYCKSLDKIYIVKIKEKIRHLFNEDVKSLNFKKHDFHKFLIHYCYDKCLTHQSKLMNYVALYGFLRVISLILNFWCIYQLYNLLFKYELDLVNGSIIPLMFFILNCFLVYITYLSYLKFYRRYSQENLMVLLLIKEDNTEPNTI